MLYQTNAPSFADQYSEGDRRREHRGRLLRREPLARRPTPRATRSSWPSTRRCSAATSAPEDAADAYAAAQVLQAAVEAVGTVEQADQLKLADWLRANEVDTILGPLSWNEDGSPKGEFLIGQWQNGKAEIVLPRGRGDVGHDRRGLRSRR